MFPIQSFEDANPFFTGLRYGTDTASRRLKNQYQANINQVQPQTLQEELLKLQLENQYYGPKAQAGIDLIRQGQIPHYQAQNRLIDQGQIPHYQNQVKQSKDPWSKISTYPELFKAQSLHQHYVDTLGADHPIALDAEKNYEIMQKNAQVLGHYRKAMGDAVPQRFLSSTAKDLLAAAQTSQGNYPSAIGTPAGQPISPPIQEVPSQGEPPSPNQAINGTQAAPASPQPQAQQGQQRAPSATDAPPLTAQEMTGLLTGSGIKKSATTSLLNRIHFMSLADNTFNNMLPDIPAMEYYTGGEGRARLAADKAGAATGKSSPEYQSYVRYKTNAGFLATQLRTAYGDSVQEEAAKKLAELTNPSAWDKDPAAAHEALMTFYKTFTQELEKSRETLMNPLSVYRKEDKPKPIKTLTQLNNVEKAQEEKIINGKRYIKVNGKVYEK